ncbi:MAG: YheC/YheD family protein [Oligoflexales bacterium]
MRVFLLVALIFGCKINAAEMSQTVLGVILNKDRRHGLFEQAKKSGVRAYRIDHKSSIKKDHITNVRIWDGQNWKRISRAPLPTVTYDYSFYKKHPNRKTAAKLIEDIYSLDLPRINPSVILNTLSDKLKFANVMAKSHLNHPETIEYTDKAFEQKLEDWDLIYLKPYNGNQSRGIVVVKKNDAGVLLEFEGPENNNEDDTASSSIQKEKIHSKLVASSDFEEVLEELNKAKTIMSSTDTRYLIQEGQKFFQFDEQRTNFRATVQRGEGGLLECTALTIKIGGNVALGGTTEMPEPFIKRISIKAQQTVETLIGKLKNAAVDTCLEMEKYHDIKIGELGIDLGMLPDGQVVIIEANTKPGYIYYRKDFYKYFSPYRQMEAEQAEETRDRALISYAQYLSQMY